MTPDVSIVSIGDKKGQILQDQMNVNWYSPQYWLKWYGHMNSNINKSLHHHNTPNWYREWSDCDIDQT